VARERVKRLQQRYQHLFHDTAAFEMFALPQDVTKINARHVQVIVDDAEKPPWLIVAGWSCEDLSPAGNGAGLAGKRSGLFYPLLRVIRMFQYWAPENTVGYLLENVAMQFNWKHRGPREDFMVIQHLVGKATTVDAARLGSYTHRLRNFFTNLVDPVILQDQLDAIERPVNLGAVSAFPPHVELQPLRFLRKAPYYTCGVVGQPPQAMPTLMARKRSYSFRDNGPGVVYDRVLGPREPNITERELLLGYPKGTVDIPGIGDNDKHRITGGCMDAITMTTLIRLAIPEHCDAHPLNNALLSLGEGDGIATVEPEHDICEATDNMDDFQGASGNARTTTDGNDAPDEIWEDHPTIQYIRTGKHDAGVSYSDKRRAQRRARCFRFAGDTLMRVRADGSLRQVPKPETREDILQRVHASTGHFGVKRSGGLICTRTS
jgi:hypothetical protein